MFANGPGDLGSIPGRVIPKTLKMELDTTLLNTQHYKVRFKGKVEQSREWSSALPYTFRTLISILAILKNSVVWMVSNRPSTSKPSSPFNNSLVIVPKAPTMIIIIVTFTFYIFLNSLARSRYLFFFSFPFGFSLWSAGTAKSTIFKLSFFFVHFYKVWSSGQN